MALRHWTARGTTLLAGLAVCSSVWGQTLTLQKNSRGIERSSSHDRDLDLDEINYADCSADETITFNIGLSTSADSQYQLEVWRGTDCSDKNTRFSDSSGCVRLASLDPSGLTAQIPVTVRAIVAGNPTSNSGSGGTGGTGGSGSGGTSDNGGSGGTFGSPTAGTFGSSGTSSFAQAAGFGATAGSDAGGSSGTAGSDGLSSGGAEGGTDTGGTAGNAASGGADGTRGGSGGSPGGNSGGTGGMTVEGIEACESSYSTPQKASLHFILADASGNPPANYTPQDWTVTYDLVGPAPPTDVKAGIGENTLVLSWALPNDTTEIDGYDAYCDPPPGGGVIGAAGADSEPPGGGQNCDSSSVVPNELPPNAFLCGSTRGATASMETERLENGVSYTVAIAARDNFKNRGSLSATACNTPQVVTDFFEAYRNAGGKAGGGFCAIHASPSRSLVGALAVAALALVARRRSRRDTVPKDPS
jgi:hypothetical protein